MRERLRLGLIGASEGNGHPYSWAAILNGYDRRAMAACPYPVIPEYLAERAFPGDFLTAEAEVTTVWTQDPALSRRIAAAARIGSVACGPEAMIGRIDAVLLARDDSENHLAHAGPFLDAGLPIYIDKPLATSLEAADRLFERERYPGQIFTSSALRWSPELRLSRRRLAALGPLERLEGFTPKSWERYAVHVIEPALSYLPTPLPIVRSSRRREGAGCRLELALADGTEVVFVATGTEGAPIALEICGRDAKVRLTFEDPFTAFREALRRFCDAARRRTRAIPRSETLEVVRVLELGAA